MAVMDKADFENQYRDAKSLLICLDEYEKACQKAMAVFTQVTTSMEALTDVAQRMGASIGSSDDTKVRLLKANARVTAFRRDQNLEALGEKLDSFSLGDGRTLRSAATRLLQMAKERKLSKEAMEKCVKTHPKDKDLRRLKEATDVFEAKDHNFGHEYRYVCGRRDLLVPQLVSHTLGVSNDFFATLSQSVANAKAILDENIAQAPPTGAATTGPTDAKPLRSESDLMGAPSTSFSAVDVAAVEGRPLNSVYAVDKPKPPPDLSQAPPLYGHRYLQAHATAPVDGTLVQSACSNAPAPPSYDASLPPAPVPESSCARVKLFSTGGS